MTKKDYIQFAKMIKERNDYINDSWEDWRLSATDLAVMSTRSSELKFLTSQIADIFESDNPQFDRERFLKACGIE